MRARRLSDIWSTSQQQAQVRPARGCAAPGAGTVPAALSASGRHNTPLLWLAVAPLTYNLTIVRPSFGNFNLVGSGKPAANNKVHLPCKARLAAAAGSMCALRCAVPTARSHCNSGAPPLRPSPSGGL